MAEEQSASTPSGEAPAPMTEQQALDNIASRLNPDAETTPDELPVETEPEGELDAEPEAPEGEEGEPEREQSETDDPESEDPEKEPETTEDETEKEPEKEPETEEVEVPDTFQGLAEMLQVDPVDLAGHVQLEMTDKEGNVTTLSVAEALRGTISQADYTQRMQVMADERRAFEAERGQAVTAYNEKVVQTDDMIAVLAQELDAGISDDQLMDLIDPDSPNYDRDEYERAKTHRDRRHHQLAQAIGVRQQQRADDAKAAEEAQVQFRTDQIANLQNLLPETKDQKDLNALETDIREYLTQVIPPQIQFTQEAVDEFFGNFIDAQVYIIKDALSYRKLQGAAKPTVKKLKGLPKIGKPNTTASRNNAGKTTLEKSRADVRRGGGQEAAVKMIGQMLKR